MGSRGDRSNLIALIVAAAFFMETLDATVIVTALPAIAESFGTTPVAVSAGITAYLLALVVFIPVSGWLADRIGARTVLCAAIGVFTLASAACGLSQDLTTFIAARTLQGASAALMSPVGRLVVLRATPKERLIQSIALITWPGLVGPVVGPAIGGFLVTYASWRWIFFINIPLGLLGMLLVAMFVENSRGAARRPFDTRGFVAIAGSLALLIYGLKALSEGGGAMAAGALLIAGGASLGWLALRHAAHAEHPLVDLSPLGIPTFARCAAGAGMVLRVTSGAVPFLLPLLFQIAFGMTAFAAGLMVLAYAAGNLGIKPVTTLLLRALGFRRLLLANGTLASLFILACAALYPGTPEPIVIATLFVAGCLRSIQHTAITTLTFADVPAENRSAATTFAAMTQQLATSLGVALGALALTASSMLRGADAHALAHADFQIALAVAALAAIASTLRFARLPADAGAEVTGRAPAPAQDRAGR